MRRLLLLGIALLGFAAMGGIAIDTSAPITFTDCAAGGSAAQQLAGGFDYLVTVTDENTWLCLAASGSICASGGTKLPSGTVFVLAVGAGGASASCRSTGATGDIQFTKKTN